MILIVVAGVLSLWLLVWPRLLTRVIYTPNRFLTWLRWQVGNVALLVTGAAAVGLWVALVAFSDGVQWTDAEPQIAALALSAAIAFTYGNLAPPSVAPRFIEVDHETGHLAAVGTRRVRLSRGRYQPITLAVWNVGSTSWGSYRINAQFPAGCDLALTHEDVPASPTWDWSPTEGAAFGRQSPWIQIDRGRPIAPAEPAIIRFVANPRVARGTYNVQITIGCAGKLGETRSFVEIEVV